MFLYCFLLYLNLVFMVGVHDRIPEMTGILFFLFVSAKIRFFFFTILRNWYSFFSFFSEDSA